MKKVGSFDDVNLVGTHGNIKTLKLSKPLRPPITRSKGKKLDPLAIAASSHLMSEIK
jgi:hypothetical protein